MKTPEGALKWKMAGESKHFKAEDFSKTDDAKQFVQDVDDCIQGNYATLTCGVHDRYASMCIFFGREVMTLDQTSTTKKKLKKAKTDYPNPKPEVKGKIKEKSKVIKPQMTKLTPKIKSRSHASKLSSNDYSSFVSRAEEAEKRIARLSKLYEEVFRK